MMNRCAVILIPLQAIEDGECEDGEEEENEDHALAQSSPCVR